MQKPLLILLALATVIPSLNIIAVPEASLAAIILQVTAVLAYLYLVTSYAPFKPLLTTTWPVAAIIVAQCLQLAAIHANPWAILHPLMLLFTIFTLRKTQHPWMQINRFILSLFACLLMWPAAMSPLPAIGLFIFSLVLLLSEQRVNMLETTARILLLASTTIVHPTLAILPAFTGFSLLATWPKRAIAVIALGTAVSLSILTYLPQSGFSVAQVQLLLPDGSFFAALALLAIVVVQSIYHWRWWPATQHAAWLLGTLLMVITLADLAQTGSFAFWNTAQLLTLALPLVIHTLLRPNYTR